MKSRSLALLTLLLPVAAGDDDVSPLASDPAVAAHVLSAARKELKASRDEFKSLSPDDRGVIKKARASVADSPEWRALAPTFCAAADLLDAASAGTGAAADLCGHMARSYRAMAEELDKESSYLTDAMRERAPADRAEATLAEAQKLLAAAAEGMLEEANSTAWERVKRADPRYRAVALNMKTLARAYATLAEKEHEEKLAAAIANAAKLQKALEPYFEGVRTSKRDEPEPEPPAPPPARRVRPMG